MAENMVLVTSAAATKVGKAAYPSEVDCVQSDKVATYCHSAIELKRGDEEAG